MLSEFDVIHRYFMPPAPDDSRIVLGGGDDCALLRLSSSSEMAISTDMLVEGRHFFAGANPEWLGHKCLAVNLSDLAAMAAKPVAFTLALSLPEIAPKWLAGFSKGLLALAAEYGCSLIGGDTTKGPLTICITVFGECPAGKALRRSGALPRDDIWVSGSLGGARLVLASLRNEPLDELPAPGGAAGDSAALLDAEQRLHRPTPRIALGVALRNLATSAIDISDGLMGDLEHVLQRSGVGATIDVDALPAHPALAGRSHSQRRDWMLTGGDDYELCFTATSNKRDEIIAAGLASGVAVTRVGHIDDLPEDRFPSLRLQDAAGATFSPSFHSFDHFRTE